MVVKFISETFINYIKVIYSFFSNKYKVIDLHIKKEFNIKVIDF
jgi:hypothetical protein